MTESTHHPHHEVGEDGDPQSGQDEGQHEAVLPASFGTVRDGKIEQQQQRPWEQPFYFVTNIPCSRKMQKHHGLGSGTTDTVFTQYSHSNHRDNENVKSHYWKDGIIKMYPLQYEWFIREHINPILGMWKGEMVSLSSAFAALSSGTFPFSISTFPSITWVSTPLAAWNNFWRFQETETQVKEQMSSLVLVRLAWKQPGGGKETVQPHFKGNSWSLVVKYWHFKHFMSSNTTAVPP